MLKLVLGGSGSGKTTLLYSRIRARAEAGRYSILLAVSYTHLTAFEDPGRQCAAAH